MLPGAPVEEAEKEGMNREVGGEHRADSIPRRMVLSSSGAAKASEKVGAFKKEAFKRQ